MARLRADWTRKVIPQLAALCHAASLCDQAAPGGECRRSCSQCSVREDPVLSSRGNVQPRPLLRSGRPSPPGCDCAGRRVRSGEPQNRRALRPARATLRALVRAEKRRAIASRPATLREPCAPRAAGRLRLAQATLREPCAPRAAGRLRLAQATMRRPSPPSSAHIRSSARVTASNRKSVSAALMISGGQNERTSPSGRKMTP